MPIDVNTFRVPLYTRIDLNDKPTSCPRCYSSAGDYDKRINRNKDRLFELQEILTANETWSVLLIFQAMDTGGKDEVIKYLLDCFDPQNCLATPFKKPNEHEARYSFLRKAWKALPGSGRISVFNRSYYEQVVADRIHPDKISIHLPESQRGHDTIWEERYEDIGASERHWARNGVKILKFFLHISPEEQKKRLLERIETPSRTWEFSQSDIEERQYFSEYLRWYDEAIFRTNSEAAPWYVIPSDDDKNARLIISDIVIKSLESLGQDWPEPDAQKQKELSKARKLLKAE